MQYRSIATGNKRASRHDGVCVSTTSQGGYDSVSETDSAFKATGFSQSTYNEIGVGFNYFLGEDGAAGNHAKFGFDVDYLPDGTPAVGGLDYQSETSNHGETVFRSQFQLWI